MRLPIVLLPVLAAVLLQLLHGAQFAQGAVDLPRSYARPVPAPSLVFASLFQRGSRWVAGKGPSSLLFVSSSTQIQAYETTSGELKWEHWLNRTTTRPLLDESTGEPVLDDTTGEPVLVTEEEAPMAPPAPGSDDTPAAGQFVVDALGDVWVVTASARWLQRFTAVGSAGPSLVEGGAVDLVAAGLGPAESLVVQSIDVLEDSRVAVYSLPSLPTSADGDASLEPRVPVLALFNSSTAPPQWHITELGSNYTECSWHPRHIAMLIPNDGKPPGNAASAGSAPLYVQCGGLISAIDVDTQEVLWQKAYPVRQLPASSVPAGPDADADAPPRFVFPRMQAASPETGDLFVSYESTAEQDDGAPVPSIERLAARSGASSSATFSPTRVADDSLLPEGIRDQVQMLTIVADVKSCLTESVPCKDKLLVHVYNSVAAPTTPASGEAGTASASSYAFLSAYAPPADPAQPGRLLWDTTKSFLPPGGSHSPPYARSDAQGNDELYWLVRSKHPEPQQQPDTGSGTEQSTVSAYDLPILYVVRAADGAQLRSFDTESLGLTELSQSAWSSAASSFSSSSSGGGPAEPPSCSVLEVQPDGTVFLSCPYVFGHVIAIKPDDDAWVLAENVPDLDTDAEDSSTGGSSGSSGSSSTGGEATGGSTAESGDESSTGMSTGADEWSSTGADEWSSTGASVEDSSSGAGSSGDDSSTASSTAMEPSSTAEAWSSTGDSLSSSSSAGVAPIPPVTPGDSDGEGARGSTSSSTGSGVIPGPSSGASDKDRDYIPAADQDFVRAFVAAFSALIACVLLVVGVRWWRTRAERARGLHMELSQRSSPRLGGAIMLDGSLDPEWDEADEAEAAPHWPSESGGHAGGAGGRGGELSEHEQQMIELEEAIGAGLGGNYSDDDFEQLHLDEREFRNAIGHAGDSSADRINTARASDMP